MTDRESPREDRFCEKHGYSYAGDKCPSCERYEQGGASPIPARNSGENLNDYLERLAAIYGWGSREVQDAHDYGMGTTPDE